ncbi:MAG: 3'(2'),5'-bisphosphate nucleotidase CysQ [Nitrospirales bacterium]
MSLYTHELETIRIALDRVSERLKRILYEGLQITIKADGSPVTNADLEVNEILQDALLEAYPKDAWLSEESPDNPSRLQSQRVWILDPIDGTKPFIKSLPHYTISLALIDQGQPAIGVIFNPATQEYFCAVQGQPATLNGQPILVRTTAEPAPRTFLVNTWHVGNPLLKAWRSQHHCPPLLGSIAYSLALVAAGHVDGVINVGPQNEWDIAAGLLIVQAAGGLVFDNHQQPIQCNQPNPTVNGIIAIRPDALPTIQNWLTDLKV